ncbi:MAG TPA: hypothetical protein VIR78_09225, partial [Malonomonas sp.]
PNCFLGEAALRFGLTGNSLIINRADPSRLAALKLGLEELAWSEQCGVLVGIVDLPAPAELAAADDLPGSLFLLLENAPRSGSGSYGELSLAGDAMFFNGERMADLPQLIAACLKLPAPAF